MKSMDNTNHCNDVQSPEQTNLFSLHLDVHQGEDIDNSSGQPDIWKRRYRAVFSLGAGEADQVVITKEVQGLLDPVWRQQFCIPLGDELMFYDFLNVEVVRLLPSSDPGPSSGVVVVGRAQIPIPKKVFKKKNLRFGLVRFGEYGPKAEGFILISMEIIKYCLC